MSKKKPERQLKIYLETFNVITIGRNKRLDLSFGKALF